MGKKKIISERELKSMVYPSKYDVVGIVQKMLGNDRAMVKCSDGYVRTCRIRGKMKRRIWVREGDAVLVAGSTHPGEEEAVAEEDPPERAVDASDGVDVSPGHEHGSEEGVSS